MSESSGLDRTPPATRVLIVDDDLMVQHALSDYLTLAPEVHVAHMTTTAEGAIDFLEGNCVDIVLMDVRLPGRSGVEATPQVISLCPQASVIMLTSYANSEFIRSALAAGAVGYLLKNTRAPQLVAAIRAVRQGLPILSPEILPKTMPHHVARASIPDLSEKERMVLQRLCEGMSNAEISNSIYLSEASVKGYVHSLMKKFAVDSRLRLVVRAHELGLARTSENGPRS